MNFFEQQAIRRKKTRQLIFLFALAVICTIVAIYLLLTPLWQTENTPWIWWNTRAAIITTLAVSSIILFGALYRIYTLKGDGAAIAKALGGREITTGKIQGLAEKRLYNVVEEMAIASGIPVPRIFILDQENSINAFAAGYNIHDAAIAVSKGCLEQLSRDELQGVIAHEYSHILNGDMRLNIRLIGILGGILTLATIGRILLEISARSRGGRDSSGLIFLIGGLALILIGYIGVFFGRLIKAAVSREREYLADASAVQFTRNPEGIAGALSKILKWTSGSYINHPMAEEASHLFFSQGIKQKLSFLTATHPPLEKRIAAIKGIRLPAVQTPPPQPPASETPPIHPLIAQIGEVPTQVNHIVDTVTQKIPHTLWQTIHDPAHVKTVIDALILTENTTDRTAQLNIIRHDAGEEAANAAALLVPKIPTENETRWVILQTCIPALRESTDHERQKFLHRIKKLTLADGRLSFMELTIEILLEKWLISENHPRPTLKNKAATSDMLSIILHALAKAGHRDNVTLQESALKAGWHILFPHDPIPEKKEITYHDLRKALIALSSATPEIKELLIHACSATITHDEHIYRKEKDLLRMIAIVWDCPMPPIEINT